MIEVIKDKNDWDAIANTNTGCDIYHTYDYHAITKNGGETPILLHYKKNDTRISIPLLLRNIEGSPYKDATSVYGYAGPLIENMKNNFSNADFANDLDMFFNDHQIVSIFSRLNPFVAKQEKVLCGLGEISSPGRIVYIDLTENIEKQKANYNRRFQTYINKSRRLCNIRKANTDNDIHCFIEMYHENMARVNAKSHYFFDSSYFFKLIKSSDFESELLLAEYEGKIVSGALFLKKNHIIQYHLSGTRKEYLFLNPIKLLIDEMRIIGTNENYGQLNLGGGVSNIEDSLFEFKSGFSKNLKEFKLWKYIVNHNIYNELTQKNYERMAKTPETPSPIFFPLYRLNA